VQAVVFPQEAQEVQVALGVAVALQLAQLVQDAAAQVAQLVQLPPHDAQLVHDAVVLAGVDAQVEQAGVVALQVAQVEEPHVPLVQVAPEHVVQDGGSAASTTGAAAEMSPTVAMITARVPASTLPI